jgi:hypothetical protein
MYWLLAKVVLIAKDTDFCDANSIFSAFLKDYQI